MAKAVFIALTMAVIFQGLFTYVAAVNNTTFTPATGDGPEIWITICINYPCNSTTVNSTSQAYKALECNLTDNLITLYQSVQLKSISVMNFTCKDNNNSVEAKVNVTFGTGIPCNVSINETLMSEISDGSLGDLPVINTTVEIEFHAMDNSTACLTTSTISPTNSITTPMTSTTPLTTSTTTPTTSTTTTTTSTTTTSTSTTPTTTSTTTTTTSTTTTTTSTISPTTSATPPPTSTPSPTSVPATGDGPEVRIIITIITQCNATTENRSSAVHEALQNNLRENLVAVYSSVKLKFVSSISVTCKDNNTKVDARVYVRFDTGIPANVFIKELLVNKISGGTLGGLSVSPTVEVDFIGITISSTAKGDECQKKCCDGAGGAITVERVCTPTDKCAGRDQDPDKQENGHCNTGGLCQAEAEKCDDSSSSLSSSPSLGVIVLLAFATFVGAMI